MTWSLSRLLGRKSFRRSRWAPIRRPSLQVESLERREVPANLSVYDIKLSDKIGRQADSVAVGQLVDVTVKVLNANAAPHSLLFATVSLGGVTKTGMILPGANGIETFT